jgi:hypothetical protein
MGEHHNRRPTADAPEADPASTQADLPRYRTLLLTVAGGVATITVKDGQTGKPDGG